MVVTRQNQKELDINVEHTFFLRTFAGSGFRRSRAVDNYGLDRNQNSQRIMLDKTKQNKGKQARPLDF